MTAIAPRVAKSLSRAIKLRGHIARRGRNFAIAPFVGFRSASAVLGSFEGEKGATTSLPRQGRCLLASDKYSEHAVLISFELCRR